MIKDLFVAIALGTILGVVATGGYFTYKNSKTKTPDITPTPIISVSPSISPSAEKTIEKNSDITITSPENESVIATSQTTIQGITKPNSTIIIKDSNKTYNTTSDTTGHFEYEVSLESGINHYLISAFDTDDNQYDTQLLVTYSTAKF